MHEMVVMRNSESTDSFVRNLPDPLIVTLLIPLEEL